MRSRIRLSALIALFTVLLALAIPLSAADVPAVKVWETTMVIPTYLAGDPEPNPMFYFGRQSQGAQAPVYPYPMYDTLTGKKVDKTYKMVYLENEYIRIGILPEIGGRIFEGVDKTNSYNFIYRQHVIKPALISIIGAWISGGVEWNIPHHHRASTFLPVQYKVEENADGSKTVWVGELEVRQRMRWAVGYTLRPGKSYLEAVAADPEPHARGEHHAVLRQRGGSRERQLPGHLPAQHATGHRPLQARIRQVADQRRGRRRQLVEEPPWRQLGLRLELPGRFLRRLRPRQAGRHHEHRRPQRRARQEVLRPGARAGARTWDKILTDTDGPYIELMAGAYSDNQPDYSWLQPYEGRSFSMNWYPFRDIGGVKKANLDAAVNLDVTNGIGQGGLLHHLGPSRRRKSRSRPGQKVLLQETVAINPGKPYMKQVAVPAGIDEHDLVASISDGGKELVSYSPVRLKPEATPKGVTRPAAAGGRQDQRRTLSDRPARAAVPRSEHRSRCRIGKKRCAAIRAIRA